MTKSEKFLLIGSLMFWMLYFSTLTHDVITKAPETWERFISMSIAVLLSIAFVNIGEDNGTK